MYENTNGQFIKTNSFNSLDSKRPLTSESNQSSDKSQEGEIGIDNEDDEAGG